MTRTLSIAPPLIEAIREAARRAYPNECCGLIEGMSAADGWHAHAVHETGNLSEEPSRAFLIDPEAHFRVLRGLRGSGHEIIGCFHSHPDGHAEPSERDRREAADDGFVWIVAGADDVRVYVFRAARAAFEELALNRTG